MDKAYLQYRKTYNAGLLQARAFRILKKHTNNSLQSLGITATEWGILGILVNNPKGLQLSKMANLLGVKAPYVTRSLVILSEKKLLTINNDVDDNRIKIASLTNAGEVFVKKTEVIVSREIRKTFKDVSLLNLYGYLATLHSIVNQYAGEIENTELSHLED